MAFKAHCWAGQKLRRARWRFSLKGHAASNSGRDSISTYTSWALQPGRKNGLTHTFSIVSSPFSEEITLATRMRDTAFKHALSILPIGTEVGIEGPTGSFTLHSNASKPAVFLVTPLPIRPCGERPYRQPFQAFDRDHNERSAELLVAAFSLDCSLCWFGEHGFRVGVR